MRSILSILLFVPILDFSQSLQFTNWEVDLHITVPFLSISQNYTFADDTLTASSDSMSAYLPNEILYHDSSNYIEFYTIDSNYQCGNIVGKYFYQISNDTLVFNTLDDSCGHRSFLFNHNWDRSNTSTQDKHQKFVLKIYPNPTQEIITVSISNYSGEIRTKVFDLIGNKLQTTNETNINLRDYSKGIYILNVTYGDKTEELRVVKE